MRNIPCPKRKAEGMCEGFPYDTELASIDGVVIHFWLGNVPSKTLAKKLLKEAKRHRDIVGMTYSDGMPTGFWAANNLVRGR